MKYFTRLPLLIFLLIIDSANAIVIRHDVNDDLYRGMAKLYSPTMTYINGCTSTLISSNWVLTAAHCVYGSEKSLFSVKHLEKSYRIQKIIVYPKYNNKTGEEFDIALIHLRDPILNGKPAALYFNQDEKGRAVVCVGMGKFGNGRDGLIKSDHTPRAATNTVISVSPKWLKFKFNESVNATALEGISGPGDSGGPAFIEINSKLYIAGVSSWQERYGQPEGTYNVQEHYSRVSMYKDWLESTMKSSKLTQLPSHPVIEAIKSGNVERLIAAGKNDKDWLSNSSLVNEAISQTLLLDNIVMMEKLVDLGLPIDSVRINQISLFEFVLLNNRKKYFLALLKKTSLDVGIHRQNSIVLPLLVSRFINDERLINLVKVILAQGVNVDAVTSQGDTALLITGWESNNLDLVKLLIEHGANVNIANKNGDTPLMDAAYLGKKNILSQLLAKGANPDLKNKKSKTALDLAKLKKRKDIIKILLAK